MGRPTPVINVLSLMEALGERGHKLFLLRPNGSVGSQGLAYPSPQLITASRKVQAAMRIAVFMIG